MPVTGKDVAIARVAVVATSHNHKSLQNKSRLFSGFCFVGTLRYSDRWRCIILNHFERLQELRGKIPTPEIFVLHQLKVKWYGGFYSFNDILA